MDSVKEMKKTGSATVQADFRIHEAMSPKGDMSDASENDEMAREVRLERALAEYGFRPSPAATETDEEDRCSVEGEADTPEPPRKRHSEESQKQAKRIKGRFGRHRNDSHSAASASTSRPVEHDARPGALGLIQERLVRVLPGPKICMTLDITHFGAKICGKNPDARGNVREGEVIVAFNGTPLLLRENETFDRAAKSSLLKSILRRAPQYSKCHVCNHDRAVNEGLAAVRTSLTRVLEKKAPAAPRRSRKPTDAD